MPAVLYSGHHANVDKWRHENSLINTAKKRSEMLKNLDLSDRDKKILTDAGFDLEELLK